MRALNQLKQPLDPTQTTNRSPLVVQPQRIPSPRPLVPPAIERRRWGINLNEKPSDDVAVYVEEATLTCQSDREEKAARSADARKRRLEKQRERRVHRRRTHGHVFSDHHERWI
jgi:hypothetical protein